MRDKALIVLALFSMGCQQGVRPQTFKIPLDHEGVGRGFALLYQDQDGDSFPDEPEIRQKIQWDAPWASHITWQSSGQENTQSHWRMRIIQQKEGGPAVRDLPLFMFEVQSFTYSNSSSFPFTPFGGGAIQPAN